MHMDPSESESGEGTDEKKLKKVPDSVLKAALLKRAVEDIQRIVQLRQAKPALQTLLQRGSVGEELWQRFQRAEQEMEGEVRDVVEEVCDARFIALPLSMKGSGLLTFNPGQRIRTKLGPSHLPIRERDQPEHPHQAAHGGIAGTT